MLNLKKEASWLRQAVLLGVLVFSSTAFGVPISIATLIDDSTPPNFIEAGGLKYSEWEADDWCPGTGLPCRAPNFADITVEAVDSESGGSLSNPGLHWVGNGQFATKDDQVVWLRFRFKVGPSDPLDLIYGMQIESEGGVLDPPPQPIPPPGGDPAWGDISSTNYSDNSYDPSGELITVEVNPFRDMSSALYFDPRGETWAETFLFVSSQDGHEASLDGGYQRFPLEEFVPTQPAPVPAPWLLMSLGLAVIGWMTRRR